MKKKTTSKTPNSHANQKSNIPRDKAKQVDSTRKTAKIIPLNSREHIYRKIIERTERGY